MNIGMTIIYCKPLLLIIALVVRSRKKMERIGEVDKMSSKTTENPSASLQDRKKEQSQEGETFELSDGGPQIHSGKEDEDKEYYLTSWKLASVIIGLCLNVLCLALVYGAQHH